MSAVPTASAPVSGTGASNGAVNKSEDSPQDIKNLESGNGDSQQVNWESELQLVSSLAKLQELERKVSRTLLNYFDLFLVFQYTSSCLFLWYL